MPDVKSKKTVFLCHSSGDKEKIREINVRLKKDGVETWLDEQDLLPGEDWEEAISKAIIDSEIVIVFLSKSSVSKAGFLNKEIKYALDRADEQPNGKIYLVPARLDDCDIPKRLSRWHWVNLFEESGYQKLIKSLPAKKNSK
jgi:hypothetical protein